VSAAAVSAWEARGAYHDLGGHRLFAVDLPAVDEQAEPVVILHGFPTSSLDWHLVVDRLAAHRRVVALDLLGFGLSAKPDRRYSIELQCDLAEVLLARLGVERFALATHDMGDSVGGELLARQLAGTTELAVTRRVITNGSIYLDLAQLTAGQQYLLSLPDEKAWPPLGDPAEVLRGSLAATCAPEHVPDDAELDAHVALILREEGDALLPRLIRYIEDRRARESRYTGAIEDHPSALTIVWGDQDPIAVVAMAHRLAARRPDARLDLLEGVGHYPMLEAPDRFAAAVVAGLGGS
jgi:pimeloyl-ACP methyl ester carboxylesterase